MTEASPNRTRHATAPASDLLRGLDVALDGGAAPFPARFGHRVPKDRIATLAVGSRLRVAVDPSKPSEAVAIDWDRS